MKRKNGNTINGKIIGSRIVTVVCILALIAISIPAYKNIKKRSAVHKEIENLENEIKETERKNTDLQKFIKYLDSDQFAEEQARMNLGLKKEGEEVIVVSGIDSQRKGAENEINVFNIPGLAAEQKKSNNLKNWWDYFLNK